MSRLALAPDPRLRRAFVVGGNASHVYGTLAKRLADWGLTVHAHHDMTNARQPQALPAGTEALIVFNDMIALHALADKVVREARSSGVPVVRTSRAAAMMARDLERAGFTRLPGRGLSALTDVEVAEAFSEEQAPVLPTEGYLAVPSNRDPVLVRLSVDPGQWADTPEDARILASVVWPDVEDFVVIDRRGGLVSAPPPVPIPAVVTPFPAARWAACLENPMGATLSPTPEKARSRKFVVDLSLTEGQRLDGALERFNLIREIAGQPVLTADEFVVRLLGDGLIAQEGKFARLAALTK